MGLKQPELDYICIGPNCFGRSEDPRTAVSRAKSEGSSTKKFVYILYRVGPTTTISHMDGSLSWSKEDYEPHLIFKSKELKGKEGRVG